jgi:hypothetical protein
MRGSTNRRILTIVVGVLAVVIVGFLAIGLLFPNSWPGQVLRGSALFGGPNEPNYGAIVVDGNPGEWDLNLDYFADMYKAADPTKAVLAKLYLRYDCDANKLGLLVLAQPGNAIDVASGLDEHFVKLGAQKLIDANFAPPDGEPPPDFAWVGLSGDGRTAAGWEASVTLYEGSYSNFDVHSNVLDAAGQSQTAQVEDMEIALEIDCTPTAVFLNYFKAGYMGTGFAQASSIQVKWETSAEIDNAGFNLYRGPSPEGPWNKLNQDLIPSQVPPGSPVGATYEWVDSNIKMGATYFYLLEDVDVNGVATKHGPVRP